LVVTIEISHDQGRSTADKPFDAHRLSGLYGERTILLIKWLATLIAAVAKAVVLQLFKRKLLPQISALVEKVYGGRK